MSEHRDHSLQELLDELKRVREQAEELSARTRPVLEDELRDSFELSAEPHRSQQRSKKR